MTNNRILKRKRIEQALDNIFRYPLTVVSATMGYGKTTAVRTFLSARKVNTIWISLVGSQGSEALFWNKLCTTVGKYYPEIGAELTEFGFPLNQHQIHKIIDYVIDKKTDQNIVLVIDDYHLIEHNNLVGTLVELIVQEEIPNLHFVLISRTRPNFSHVTLLAKGLCYYIDSNSLAFTGNEIEEYFELMGFHPLTQTELEGIQNYTMGWISAIYLIMLGKKQGLRTEVSANINQLVEDNLFNQMDTEIREAVLGLSIFDNFTIKQAEAVLQNRNVRQIIKLLVDKNAFIECDPLTGAYKLHNVLLDYLRSKLEDSSMDVKSICCRAGHWYLILGDYVTAFDYYHRAGRVEELLHHLSKIENVNISFLGNRLMRDICNDLPQHLCIKYPMLFLQIALNFTFSGEKSLIDQGVGIISIIRDFYGQSEGFPPNLCDRIFAEIEIIYAILSFNDIKLMLEHARKAEELFHGGNSSLILWHSEFTFGLPHFLYSYYKESGKLNETVEYIAKGFTPSFLDGCGTGCEYLVLAEAFLERGDLEKAELYAQKAIYKARTKRQVCIELCADFTLARRYLYEGRFANLKDLQKSIKEMLSELKPRLPIQSNLIFNTTVDLCDGYLSGCMKLPESIPDWLRNGDFSNAAYMFQGLAFPCIIYGKAVLLSENWIELEILCESFKPKFHVAQNQLGLLHNSIHEAVAKYKLYGMDAGIHALLPVILEAQEDGIVMPFAENADFLLPMLECINEKDGIDTVFYGNLLNHCRKYSENLKSKDAAVLTERETQVLRLLYEGLTKKEIAEHLVVSASTVKRHLENIYQKLEVNNKISAIKSARNLKII